MNTIQLSAIMDKILANTHFLGVLACDQLPKRAVQKLPSSVIINTHSSDLPGEHWLAVYITEDRVGCFFDSFGNSPSNKMFPPSVYEFLRITCTSLQFSNKQVQGFTSVTCGQHCVFFLYQMSRGLDYDDVICKYSDDLAKNDDMVLLFVKKLQPCICISNVLNCIQHAQMGEMFIKKR